MSRDNKSIFNKRLETQQRHSNMTCKVFELKLDHSKLSKTSLKQLHSFFSEAKWLYNNILEHGNQHKDISSFDTTKNVVNVKLPDGTFEQRIISLPAQIKQSLKDKTFQSIKSLSSLKKNGKTIGKLKFKHEINSIPLKQFNVTYKLKDNKLKLPKIKQLLKIYGHKQLEGSVDICNANLIRKHGNYFLNITTYWKHNPIEQNHEAIGLDFGIKDSIVFSNGVKINTEVEIPQSLKKIQRKLSRQHKGSKNYLKQRIKLQKQHVKVINRKKNIKNNIINILKPYEIIAIQNENIKAWHHGRYGKTIQKSTIGGIISGIKKLPQTAIVDRFFPSTKTCSCCGSIKNVELSERTYECLECGVVLDRDINAASNIKKKILADCKEFKPVETMINTRLMIEKFLALQIMSVKQEAHCFSCG